MSHIPCPPDNRYASPHLPSHMCGFCNALCACQHFVGGGDRVGVGILMAILCLRAPEGGVLTPYFDHCDILMFDHNFAKYWGLEHSAAFGFGSVADIFPGVNLI